MARLISSRFIFFFNFYLFFYNKSLNNKLILLALPFHGSAAVPNYQNNLLFLNRGAGYFNGRNITIAEPVVIVIDRTTGGILRQWGENFFFHPHGIEAARNGDIFITDVVLHQVFKVFIVLSLIM